MKLGGEGEGHIFEIAIRAAHGGMDDDGNPRRFDFIKEKVGLGGTIENEVEAELFAETERGGNVLVPLCVDKERDLFIKNINKGLNLNVGSGRLYFLVVLGSFDLTGMGLPLEEFGTEHRDSFRAGPGGFTETFGAQAGCDRGGRDEGILQRGDGGNIGLHYHELSGNESAGSVTGMDSRHAEITEPFHERIAPVVSIYSAEFGLDRSGVIELFLVVLG